VTVDHRMFIIDQKQISTFTFQFQRTSVWPIQQGDHSHLKIDNSLKLIYVTLFGQHQIMVYTKDGKLQKNIGSIDSSSKLGEFNHPRGLTIYKNVLYVCDGGNHRIQALSKENYSYLNGWGNKGTKNSQFSWPYSIGCYDDLLYVGDDYSVQIFTCQGTFLQRIGGNDFGTDKGQFKFAWGLCVVKDQLYVSDVKNRRIQIFKKQRVS